jgi:hypothetical protein
MWWQTVTHGRGSEGETGEWSGQLVLFTLLRNMVYPALLPLMRVPRLTVVDWTDAPRRFKWTRPFRRKKKSGLCSCSITLQTQSTDWMGSCVGPRPDMNVWRSLFHTGTENPDCPIHSLVSIPTRLTWLLCIIVEFNFLLSVFQFNFGTCCWWSGPGAKAPAALQPLDLFYTLFSRSSHCRHQMSPRPTWRQRSEQRKVELNRRKRVAENFA